MQRLCLIGVVVAVLACSEKTKNAIAVGSAFSADQWRDSIVTDPMDGKITVALWVPSVDAINSSGRRAIPILRIECHPEGTATGIYISAHYLVSGDRDIVSVRYKGDDGKLYSELWKQDYEDESILPSDLKTTEAMWHAVLNNKVLLIELQRNDLFHFPTAGIRNHLPKVAASCPELVRRLTP